MIVAKGQTAAGLFIIILGYEDYGSVAMMKLDLQLLDLLRLEHAKQAGAHFWLNGRLLRDSVLLSLKTTNNSLPLHPSLDGRRRVMGMGLVSTKELDEPPRTSSSSSQQGSSACLSWL